MRGIEMAAPPVKGHIVLIALANLPQDNTQRRAAEPCPGTFIGVGIETNANGIRRAGFFGAVFRRTPSIQKRFEGGKARPVEGSFAAVAIVHRVRRIEAETGQKVVRHRNVR